MGTETERQDVKKAMAYDLVRIFMGSPDKDTYTVAELLKLVDDYITASTEK